MTDEDAKTEEVNLRYYSFGSGRVREAIRDRIIAVWRDTPAECREAVITGLYRVSSYVESVYRSNAFNASGDLSTWFALEHQSAEQILGASKAWYAAGVAAAAMVDDLDEDDPDDHDDEAAVYGRTVVFEPDSSNWIFVRFGGMPRTGRSQCGLIGEDLEDGPDQWRVELGNMTHEAGVCVFRAYRHPDHPGHLVLIEPHFECARYGVPGQEAHLLSIMPQTDDVEDIPVLQVKGTLKTVKAFDGSMRCELGSDGEYLVNASLPVQTCKTPIDHIWVNERTPVEEIVRLSRKSAFVR